MRLHALTMRHFRQHVDTHIRFAPGLTGIIGPNGAGKSTILEAIAWALYGNSAARGTRDSIRHARTPDATVRVALEFELGPHRYHVERTLRSAELQQDGVAVASGIKATNELLQRRLGMSRTEFFNTYFTGQKELDVMAALGPTDRARFLARVLGYDRLTGAQELLREKRRELVAELHGLRSAMPDPDAVAAREREAGVALREARALLAAQDAAWREATAQREALAPAWDASESARERVRGLEAERQLAGQALAAVAADAERIGAELAAVEAARAELAPLLPPLAEREARRGELDALDALAAQDAERRALEAQVTTRREEAVRLDERLAKLETAPDFEREQRVVLEAQRQALGEIEGALDEARTLWARDRQEAETRLEAMHTQQADLAAQRATLEGLGADTPCPTCSRPLGAAYRDVLALVTEQLETLQADTGYYRDRLRQLAQPSSRVVELDAQRAAAQQELAHAERRYARIQAALQEREQLRPQRTALADRLAEAERALAAMPSGYDAEAHRALRAEVRRLDEMATRVARLQATLDRASALGAQAAEVEAARRQAAARVAALAEAIAALAFDAARHEALRTEHAAAVRRAHEAEVERAEAEGVLRRAEQLGEAARRARGELVALQQRAATLEAERSLHDELDDTFTALRTELNDRLRPELSELASGFLETLTDGRYAELQLDEEYAVRVLEDGLPKAVLSGGEEDLCNLVLRLAISQMIAERAGQAFSLLILDEVFGSLDESRRDNVLALLRRLHDRFEQVMVITHIEDVREGLDRVLRVTYDAETGASRVESSAGGAEGADAAAWVVEAVA